jgi:hypothetical protein
MPSLCIAPVYRLGDTIARDRIARDRIAQEEADLRSIRSHPHHQSVPDIHKILLNTMPTGPRG